MIGIPNSAPSSARPGVPRPPRSALGTGLRPRQPAATVTIDDEAEPVGTADIEAEDDVPEAEDEADDDIEIDPDLAKTADWSSGNRSD